MGQHLFTSAEKRYQYVLIWKWQAPAPSPPGPCTQAIIALALHHSPMYRPKLITQTSRTKLESRNHIILEACFASRQRWRVKYVASSYWPGTCFCGPSSTYEMYSKTCKTMLWSVVHEACTDLSRLWFVLEAYLHPSAGSSPFLMCSPTWLCLRANSISTYRGWQGWWAHCLKR